MKTKLQKREWLVIWGGVALIVLAAAFPLTKRVSAQYELAKNRVRSAQNQLQDAQLWHAEIESDRSGEDTLKAWVEERGGGFQLYSFVSEKLRRSELEGRYTVSNKSRSDAISAVDLTINGIELSQLVELLHSLYEGKKLVVIEEFSLTAGRNGGLDARMSLISPK